MSVQVRPGIPLPGASSNGQGYSLLTRECGFNSRRLHHFISFSFNYIALLALIRGQYGAGSRYNWGNAQAHQEASCSLQEEIGERLEMYAEVGRVESRLSLLRGRSRSKGQNRSKN